MPLAIIAHGGAWDIPGELHAEHLESCEAAAGAGWTVLTSGGTALEHQRAEGQRPPVRHEAGVQDERHRALGRVQDLARHSRFRDPVQLAPGSTADTI